MILNNRLELSKRDHNAVVAASSPPAATSSVANAARKKECGRVGGTRIIAPNGEIVARARILEHTVIVFACNMDRRRGIRGNIFNFALHRERQSDCLITATKGARQGHGERT
jgi:predicted amidohydrolase